MLVAGFVASGALLSACGGLPNGTGPVVTMRKSYDSAQAASLCKQLFGSAQQVEHRFGTGKLAPLNASAHGVALYPFSNAEPATEDSSSPSRQLFQLIHKTAFAPGNLPGSTGGLPDCAWESASARGAYPPNLFLGFVLPKYASQIPSGPFGIGKGPQVDIVAVNTTGKSSHPMSYYDGYLTNVAKRLRLAGG